MNDNPCHVFYLSVSCFLCKKVLFTTSKSLGFFCGFKKCQLENVLIDSFLLAVRVRTCAYCAKHSLS